MHSHMHTMREGNSPRSSLTSCLTLLNWVCMLDSLFLSPSLSPPSLSLSFFLYRRRPFPHTLRGLLPKSVQSPSRVVLNSGPNEKNVPGIPDAFAERRRRRRRRSFWFPLHLSLHFASNQVCETLNYNMYNYFAENVFELCAVG
jgi:hypothetical protein